MCWKYLFGRRVVCDVWPTRLKSNSRLKLTFCAVCIVYICSTALSNFSILIRSCWFVSITAALYKKNAIQKKKQKKKWDLLCKITKLHFLDIKWNEISSNNYFLNTSVLIGSLWPNLHMIHHRNASWKWDMIFLYCLKITN